MSTNMTPYIWLKKSSFTEEGLIEIRRLRDWFKLYKSKIAWVNIRIAEEDEGVGGNIVAVSACRLEDDFMFNKMSVWTEEGVRHYDKEKFDLLNKMGFIEGCSCGKDMDHSKHTPANAPFTDEIHPIRYSLRKVPK